MNAEGIMSKVTRFEDLITWQKARELTHIIFALTKSDEFSRDYAFKDQVCRAVISVPANIAEGFERDGNREFVKFLSIAKGSAGEVRSLLYLALDLGYISSEQMDEAIALSLETAKLIGGLMRYLQESNKKGRKFKQHDEKDQ
jgi:four helix bundle protein